MDLASEFSRDIRAAWHRFVARTVDVRPDLHRYCRRLTGSVWDAEDLVQDTLLRAFAKLGAIHHPIADTRAYLFRIASNLWIDHMRRPEHEAPTPEHAEPAGVGAEVRDAARALMELLAPQERAAVVLKDVFDFTLEEIATILETSVGAIKSALHRGRGKLSGDTERELPAGVETAAAGELLDRFVEAFNARDIDGLTGLLRADATAEVLGMVQEYGAEAARNGSVYHTMFGEEGAPRAERAMFHGEPIVLLWYTHESGAEPAVSDVLRFRIVESAIASFRYYYFCPETLAEVTAELGLPLKDNGYCYMPNPQ